MSYQVGDLLKDKDLEHLVLLVKHLGGVSWHVWYVNANEYANVYETSLQAHYTKVEAENGQV